MTRAASRIASLALLAALVTACSPNTGAASDDKPASGASGPSAAATPSSTAAASPSPTRTCSDLTGAQAIEEWGDDVAPFVPADSAEGFPWAPADTSTYDPCADLSWIVLDVEGGTGSSPSQVMLFHAGEYVGTAVETPAAYRPAVTRANDAALEVRWPWLGPDDRDNSSASHVSTSVHTWDDTTGALTVTGERPPSGPQEAHERVASHETTAFAWPGAGGPAPDDTIAMPGFTAQQIAELAIGPLPVIDVVHALRTTGAVEGCEFYSDGSMGCIQEGWYLTSPYGDDEYGAKLMMYLAADGTALMTSGPPDSGVYNAEHLTVPTIQNGEPVSYGNLVCAMTDDVLPCWNSATGKGGVLGTHGFRAL